MARNENGGMESHFRAGMSSRRNLLWIVPFFWVKRDKLFDYDTAEDFDKMTEVFESDFLNENIYAEDEDGTWKLFCK